jgi:hypothetical protein
MEAIYFGCNDLGPGPGGGLPECTTGPYVMADMECMHAMMKQALPPTYLQPGDFLAAIVKGKPGRLAIKAGDAQTARSTFRTIYEGPRPAGYEAMQKEGAIVLGVGGDNSPWAAGECAPKRIVWAVLTRLHQPSNLLRCPAGTFFEGVMTKGYSSNETDDAVLANIIAAGYSRV